MSEGVRRKRSITLPCISDYNTDNRIAEYKLILILYLNDIEGESEYVCTTYKRYRESFIPNTSKRGNGYQKRHMSWTNVYPPICYI